MRSIRVAAGSILGFMVACSAATACSDDAPSSSLGTTSPGASTSSASSTSSGANPIDPVDMPEADGSDGSTPMSVADASVDVDAMVSMPDGGAEASAPDAAPDVYVPPVCNVRAVDVNHVLSTGQSNSVSNGGTPVISTTQPFSNLMFNVGTMTGTACGDGLGCKGYATPSSLVPLVEGDQFFNFSVETMSAGLANQAAFMAQNRGLTHSLLVSLHGRSGNTYWCLRKGGCSYQTTAQGYVIPFDDGMRQVADGKRLAEASGKSYVVRAVTAIHGESDHYSEESEFLSLNKTDGTGRLTDYGQGLIEWQRDYESSVKAITGQAEAVPLFVSQMSGWTDKPVSNLATHQLEAHENAPGKVVLIGPSYQFPFASDCLHYTSHSERWLGAYFAKAYDSTVLQCKAWEPLRPTGIRREGSSVYVKFLVPVPPLAIDTTRVAAIANYGFTYADSTNSVQISSVAISGADEVRITFTGEPTGANRRLRYAQNGVPGATCPGPTNGARGNLRDSDATVSHHKDASGKAYELFNWSVHFDVVVP